MAELEQSGTEPKPVQRVRRTRRSRLKKAPTALIVEEGGAPQIYGRYHPRPARGAIEAANLHYEPPYESPAMEIGQRAEHPEYDTGHPVERPIDVDKEAAA